MTRSWLFSLTDTTKQYNLWYDLIAKDPSFQDATFSNAPFVPSLVNELEIQNQTPGATVLRNKMSLTGGSWDVKRAIGIDLKTQVISTDTNPTSLFVEIIAS